VLAGVGRAGHGRGGQGSGAAGEAPVRAEWVGCGRGGSGVRRGQSGTSQGGWGRAAPTRGRVRRQHEEQLVAAVVRVAIQCVEEMREREKRVKERTRPGILAYVHRADTSADEHKRAGLHGGRDPMNISYIRRFKNR
jgi:hypothetical protein